MQPYYEMEDEFELKDKKEEQKTVEEKTKKLGMHEPPKLVETSLIMANHVVKRLEQKQTTDEAFTKIVRHNGENNEVEENASEQHFPDLVNPHIGDIDKASKWLIDNHFIYTGYRIGFIKVKDVLKSLFMLHNETTNIWSHMAGVFLFIILISYLSLFVGRYRLIDTIISIPSLNEISNVEYQNSHSSVNVKLDNTYSKDFIKPNYSSFEEEFLRNTYVNSTHDEHAKGASIINEDITLIPLYVHMVSALLCFSMSTFFHWFCCWNENVNSFLSRLDYGGISFLIAGSCMPPYFYLFYCEETILFAYLYSILIFSICGVAFIITLIPKFDAPRFRRLRAIVYVTAGVSSAIPCLHLIIDSNLKVDPINAFLWSFGGVLYILGATIYTLHFPERFFPKTFDYFGSSHNIFSFLLSISIFYSLLCIIDKLFRKKSSAMLIDLIC